MTVGELERLTGEVVEPTLGEWVTAPEAVAATLATSVLESSHRAGVTGVDLAAFDDRERAAIDTTDEPS